MKLNERIEKALNSQINKEFSSSYLYLSMALWFESKNWKGFSHWMRLQAQEETSHGYKILEFMNSREGHVTLEAIPAPKTEWKAVLEVMEQTYKHEQGITANINEIFSMARKDEDFATESFLKWYLDEQVEEEAHTKEILENVRMLGESKGSMFMLDKQLGKRAAQA
jgi:ferritin